MAQSDLAILGGLEILSLGETLHGTEGGGLDTVVPADGCLPPNAFRPVPRDSELAEDRVGGLFSQFVAKQTAL